MPMDRTTGARINVVTHIDQCVQNILQTPKRSRPMDLGFGTDLAPLVDLPLNAAGRAQISAATVGAVTAYETRPTIERITLELPASDPSAPVVTLQWSYDGTDESTTTEVAG